MKQVVVRAGVPQIVEVPSPSPAAGRLLVANLASVISSGTERAAVESGGGGSLPMRAVRNPDLVRRAIEHMREHGVRETLDLARGISAPDAPLGYSCAGVVVDTGGVPQFRVGQLVACAGAGAANHAELVSVPGNLTAPVPDGVNQSSAAFATLGSIALQGVRRTQPTLGERVVVVGLGLLGLLTVQLLRAAGCPVLGVEPTARRRELATDLGADSVVVPAEADSAVATWTGGVGADAVIITAASQQAAIANDAVGLLRPKGRLVLVGDVTFMFDRAPLYRRESDILISTSYGPGRYDPSYEDAGVDYPIGYVRWTENRNMIEFLRLLSTQQVRVEPLIGLELPISRAAEAYAAINGTDPPLAAVLTYDGEVSGSQQTHRPELVRTSSAIQTINARDRPVGIALIGAGSFVRAVHLPNIKADQRAQVRVVSNRSGTSAGEVARLVGGADTATDWRGAIARDDVDLVLIGTRHDSHAEIAAAALSAGKAVFVEKPLGLSRGEIDSVWTAGLDNDRLAIGFNRPFAPLARTLCTELRAAGAQPLQLVYRVNAPLPTDHWLNDPATGGGRVLGEACHMFDFANWLCGTPLRVFASSLPAPQMSRTVETLSATIVYQGGSLATIHYSGVGPGAMPKERIEVFSGGRSWVLDNFTSLTSYGADGPQLHTSRAGDKGHAELMRRVLAACRGEQLFEPGLAAAYCAQSVALAVLESVATGIATDVDPSPATVPDRPIQ